VADLVLRLDQEIAEEALRGAGRSQQLARSQVFTVLRAALDSPPVEEVTEYRVVAKYPHQPNVVPGGGTKDRRLAEEIVRGTEEAGCHIEACWLQSRAIATFSDGSTFTSPWTDLPGEGDGDDG